MVVSTDVGWGIFFRGQMHQGLWTPVADAPAHIFYGFGALGIARNYLFSSPFSPMLTVAFLELLRWAFRRSGCAPWLHSPHFCLGPLRSWCRRLQLFGGRRVDWRP